MRYKKLCKGQSTLCILPSLVNSSVNFMCINCIPAFVVWRVCLSSCRVRTTAIIWQCKQLTNFYNFKIWNFTWISLSCCWKINCCFIWFSFDASSLFIFLTWFSLFAFLKILPSVSFLNEIIKKRVLLFPYEFRNSASRVNMQHTSISQWMDGGPIEAFAFAKDLLVSWPFKVVFSCWLS